MSHHLSAMLCIMACVPVDFVMPCYAFLMSGSDWWTLLCFVMLCYAFFMSGSDWSRQPSFPVVLRGVGSIKRERPFQEHKQSTLCYVLSNLFAQEALLALEGGVDIVDPSLAEWLSMLLPSNI